MMQIPEEWAKAAEAAFMAADENESPWRAMVAAVAPLIREAALREAVAGISEHLPKYRGCQIDAAYAYALEDAIRALAAVAPLIREAALREAARMCEMSGQRINIDGRYPSYEDYANDLAEAIRERIEVSRTGEHTAEIAQAVDE